MNRDLTEALWRQFGATIDTLESAVTACPDELWTAQVWEEAPDYRTFGQYWYLGYHTLFWLDLYLSGAVEGFAPPAPYNLDELDPAGVAPAEPYTKAELLGYLRHCREKCRETIDSLTDEESARRCTFPWGELSFYELLLYNLRHVQEHASQLTLFLGQQGNDAPRWVTRSRS